MHKVIVLANRAPFVHRRTTDGRIERTRTASGLVTALEPLVGAHGGTWVAHGVGTADAAAVDCRDGLNVPPDNPRYRLRYVWLAPEENHGYYYGFANEGLWPLCHNVRVRPVFRSDDYAMYRSANERFADAVVEEAKGDAPLILVQDYHFALAPARLRRRLPASRIVSFWHVPWPRPQLFQECPQAHELLRGLLASDVIGVQTADDCANLLGAVEALSEAIVDRARGRIEYRGHVTSTRVCPVGVAPPAAHLDLPSIADCRSQVREGLGLSLDTRLGVAIDRLDYTKGIAHKCLAVERFLELYPEERGRFVFVQVAAPSRDCLTAYRETRAEIVATAARVNQRFGTAGYQPIRLVEAHYDAAAVYRLYRAAELCFVGSLNDGMNLVAKEFVSARDDQEGVLLLSQFAGAAQQLRAALLVNPRDIEMTADALSRALRMPAVEQAKRMRLLRANVSTFDAAWWARQLLEERDVDEATAWTVRSPWPRQAATGHAATAEWV